MRYCAPNSADAEILLRLREVRSAADIIIVTNDRALATACRDLGAKTSSWEAFSRKNKSRAGTEPLPDAERGNGDLEEWIHYFGLDKDSLE